MQTILVTGASGFVGQHLLDLLSRDEATITAWRRPGAAEPLRHDFDPDRVRWRDVDVLDRRTVDEEVAASPPDAVYHLAGAAHVGQAWDRVESTLCVNVVGTARLLDALRRCAPRARVLLACSALVYRESRRALTEDCPVGPSSPYGLSKLAQEALGLRAWRDDAQPVIVARAFNHVGPGQGPHFFASSFASQVAAAEAGQREPMIRVGNLDAERDLTDVRDTVRAYRALMERGETGRPYNVCSGRAYRVGAVLDGLRARSRVRVDAIVDPARLRPNDNPLVLGDHTRLHEATGWRPDIPIDRTLDDLLDDWRQRIRTAQ
jgi:GDP-4-dehydro-6-deoxy-D-mannose reductase